MRRPASERDLLLESIKRDVAFLAHKRAMQALDDVLVFGAGYCAAGNEWPPAAELAAVIMALASVVSVPNLRDMAASAAWGAAHRRGEKWEDATRASSRARLLPRLQAAKSKQQMIGRAA